MAFRPLVTIQAPSSKDKSVSTLALPAVFISPIRNDIVRYVHTLMNKNNRQPYAVSEQAGMQHSAESWGTGRAVSRIPRVSGGGTHRAGQGAFGNMCRKGRMFAPTKIWRRWHRKISKGQRRYATCSALAATAVPALVMSRGHRIEQLAEIPCVVADSEFEGITKTKAAITVLKSIHAYDDIERVRDSRKIRCGKGKSRNRRHVQKKGPLIVHHLEAGHKLVLAFRNIPGVELVNVTRLNLLKLAPGGHLGRFIVWTEGAFRELNKIFGTYKTDSEQKIGWRPPTPLLKNADITRIINSDEVQSVLRARKLVPRHHPRKRNPLKNLGAMVKLNPFALSQKRRAILASQTQKDKRSKVVKKKRVRNDKFEKVLHTPAVAPLRTEDEKSVV